MDVSLLSHFFPCLSVGILAVKVILSIIRLFQGKRDPRLIGEAVVSGALFVISILVVFSFKSNETAVEILLSLGTRFLIIYQCGFLWQFSSEYQGLRRNLATASEGICSVMTTTLSCLIPYNIGPIEDWKIIILAVFAVEHFVLNGVYLLVLWETSPISWSVRACRVRVSQTRVGRIVLLNIFFCAFAWIAGVASIIFYKEAGAGFIISLWMNILAAIVWIVQWRTIQLLASIKTFSIPATAQQLMTRLSALKNPFYIFGSSQTDRSSIFPEHNITITSS